jgi:hypothetical protein
MPRRSKRVQVAIAALNKILGYAEDMFTLREMNALVEYIEGAFVENAQEAEWDATLEAERARESR